MTTMSVTVLNTTSIAYSEAMSSIFSPRLYKLGDDHEEIVKHNSLQQKVIAR